MQAGDDRRRWRGSSSPRTDASRGSRAATRAGRRSCCTAAGGSVSTTCRSRRRTLAGENDVAWYQQRGLGAVGGGRASHGVDRMSGRPPRPRRARLAERVLVGHSWGGHLALHVAEAMPERLLGVLASTCSARSATDAGRSSTRRSSAGRGARASGRGELDELVTAGRRLGARGMRLVWPAYFADPGRAPPMPEVRFSSERSAEMGRSILAELPASRRGCRGFASQSASSTAGPDASPPRRTEPSGFRARGSRWSRVPGTSWGRGARRSCAALDASPATSAGRTRCRGRRADPGRSGARPSGTPCPRPR